ncbi:MAG: 30S ribosomal protein S17 [Planctomycetes bacterium]|nr:30S ribosomal protein S17 [Planctomycetota bacterium]
MSSPTQPASRQVLEGLVASDKMTKTISVVVQRTYRHPKYGKYVTKSKRYHAHDDQEQAGVGDLVRIELSRPLSRTKRWRLIEILAKASKTLETVGEAEMASVLGQKQAQKPSAGGGAQ